MLFRSDRKSTRLNSSHTIISYALPIRSEEHTSELQSHDNLVCRLLLEKKKLKKPRRHVVGGPRGHTATTSGGPQRREGSVRTRAYRGTLPALRRSVFCFFFFLKNRAPPKPPLFPPPPLPI